MQTFFKNIAVPFILVTFTVTVFFGFVAMSYGPDGRMQGDCPFPAAGMTSCPQNALVAALHHLSAYQSFLNVPVNSGITTLIIALLGIISLTLVFSFHPLLPLVRFPAFISYTSPPFTSQDRKIKRWLSLFEHSPSR